MESIYNMPLTLEQHFHNLVQYYPKIKFMRFWEVKSLSGF